MATLTKRTQTPLRFRLSLQHGRVFYTCRGCHHQYPHPAPLMQHLQVCHPLEPTGMVEHERVSHPCWPGESDAVIDGTVLTQ